MGSRLVSLRCMASDPVACPETFTGVSERFAAEKLIAHLDAVHVHDGNGPSWGLSWRDASGDQQIGVVYPSTIRDVTPPRCDEEVRASTSG